MVRLLLGLAFLAAGCAATASSSSASADLESVDLGAKTVVKGTIAAGQTVRVDYEPSEYPTSGLPYLALALDGDAGATATHVTVGGNFPGKPHLLVVDPAFKVLAEADGVRTDAGAEATLTLPVASAARMLLVQDPSWAVSMSFDVTAE